jgi:hypothetical protein
MVATDIAVGKMHATAARKAVEAVAMEAAMAALCWRWWPWRLPRTPCMSCGIIVARQALIEAQMYGDDAINEESRDVYVLLFL